MEFKTTFIVKNTRIETQKTDFCKTELNSLEKLLITNDFDKFNITIKSKRRAMNGYYFVDFESTNNLTIKENLREYIETHEDTLTNKSYKNNGSCIITSSRSYFVVNQKNKSKLFNAIDEFLNSDLLEV